MNASLIDFDKFIFDEMMTHPVLFTHNKATKVAIINGDNIGIANEVLKHLSVTEVCQINCQENIPDNARVKHFKGKIQNLPRESFNVIIALNKKPSTLEDFYVYLDLLTLDGIIIHECDSLFNLPVLKKMFQAMYHAGFNDLQILHFPQPSFDSGWRSSMLGTRSGTFPRIREKDIFNKAFATRYYNFDVHKAALVLPEFIREELAI